MTEEQRWLVVRCAACGQCSGQRRQGGRCPHCGMALNTTSEVVKACTSSAMLHVEVALANTPDDLRDELRRRMTKQVEPEGTQQPTMRSLLKELRAMGQEDGSIGLETVRLHLERRSVDGTPEAFMEQAEVEGVVLRLAPDRWMFFE
ncbi:MAG: hypothetical protein VX965_04900 [Candidatus Thermoplasmatota archaeon]|nr:hypothetical protein [Candidatus Thermoplasmatota archaeon]